MAFSLANIEALRYVLGSVHGFVQNCVPTLAPVVFTWYFDNAQGNENTLDGSRKIPELSRQRVPAGHWSCVPLGMNLKFSGVAANVLLASSGVNSLTLLVSCATSLAG